MTTLELAPPTTAATRLALCRTWARLKADDGNGAGTIEAAGLCAMAGVLAAALAGADFTAVATNFATGVADGVTNAFGGAGGAAAAP